MSDRDGAGRAAVVLLSGGLDSATTLAIAASRGFACHALTVDYGQRHRLEIDRAREIAERARVVEHRVARVDLGFPGASALTDSAVAVPKGRDDEAIGQGVPATYVPARNTVLLAIALAWSETLGASDVFVGVNAVDYSGYPDCRPEFLRAFEAVAASGTAAGAERGVPFRVHAPLVALSKGAIVRRALELGVEVGRTLSCYDPDSRGRPCGACDACRLRERGFAEAGVDDPARA